MNIQLIEHLTERQIVAIYNNNYNNNLYECITITTRSNFTLLPKEIKLILLQYIISNYKLYNYNIIEKLIIDYNHLSIDQNEIILSDYSSINHISDIVLQHQFVHTLSLQLYKLIKQLKQCYISDNNNTLQTTSTTKSSTIANININNVLSLISKLKKNNKSINTDYITQQQSSNSGTTSQFPSVHNNTNSNNNNNLNTLINKLKYRNSNNNRNTLNTNTNNNVVTNNVHSNTTSINIVSHYHNTQQQFQTIDNNTDHTTVNNTINTTVLSAITEQLFKRLQTLLTQLNSTECNRINQYITAKQTKSNHTTSHDITMYNDICIIANSVDEQLNHEQYILFCKQLQQLLSTSSFNNESYVNLLNYIFFIDTICIHNATIWLQCIILSLINNIKSYNIIEHCLIMYYDITYKVLILPLLLNIVDIQSDDINIDRPNKRVKTLNNANNTNIHGCNLLITTIRQTNKLNYDQLNLLKYLIDTTNDILLSNDNNDMYWSGFVYTFILSVFNNTGYHNNNIDMNNEINTNDVNTLIYGLINCMYTMVQSSTTVCSSLDYARLLQYILTYHNNIAINSISKVTKLVELINNPLKQPVQIILNKLIVTHQHVAA